MGVLPVNMPQKGGGLLRFVVVSSQIPTLARGGGGGGGVGISIDKCIKCYTSLSSYSTSINLVDAKALQRNGGKG